MYNNPTRWMRLKDGGRDKALVLSEELVRDASSDVSLLINGVPGSRVMVSLQKGEIRGRIVVEVKESAVEAVLEVIGSDFSPLRPTPSGLGVPHRLLLRGHVDEMEWFQFTYHQRELLRALRWVREEAEKKMPSILERRHSSRPKDLRLEHLKQGARPTGSGSFMLREGDAVAYMVLCHRVRGRCTLTLVHVDGNHALEPLLSIHGKIEVFVSSILDPQALMFEIGDVRELREAKKKVTMHIARALKAL